jgi:hypothetical protein
VSARSWEEELKAAIGHVHVPTGFRRPPLEAVTVSIRASVGMRRLPGRQLDMSEIEATGSCGWWWCMDPSAVKSWADLLEAAKILKAQDWDPSSLVSAKIGQALTQYEIWVEMQPDAEALFRALTRLKFKTWWGPYMRDKFLGEMSTVLEQSRKLKPDRTGKGGGRPDEISRELIQVAGSYGLDSHGVAAMLILLGADGSRLEDLRERLRKKVRRPPRPRKKPVIVSKFLPRRN